MCDVEAASDVVEPVESLDDAAPGRRAENRGFGCAALAAIAAAAMAGAAVLIGQAINQIDSPAARIIESREFGVVLNVVAIGYFFFLGASFGSFLNVVAWRAPRGRSITHPPSACPRCGVRIRGRDNVPIVGWLLLRGECRNCRSPISPRYLFAELAVGLLFATLAVGEILSGGVTLPFREPNRTTGALYNLIDPRWDLLRIYVHHAALLAYLSAAALARRDGRALPVSVAATTLTLGLVAICAWNHPNVMLVETSYPLTAGDYPLDRMAGLWASLCGAAAGATIGACLVQLRSARRHPRVWSGLPLDFLLVGAFLGWQSAVAVALLWGLLAGLSTLAPIPRSTYGVRVAKALLAWAPLICAGAWLLVWERLLS